MQTFVLSVNATGSEAATRHGLDDAIQRVEAHYAHLWKHGPTREVHVSPTVRMVLWESEDSPSLWPAWAERPDEVVASLYAPLGFEGIVGATVPLEQAPFDLARELRRSPRRALELTGPYVCASVDAASDTVDIFTDSVGMGRMFEARTPTGWVWSNRPVAALLFAGLPAEADHDAWLQSAVTDEMYAHTTPYLGVRALDPASHVHWDGRARRRHVSSVDTIATWVPQTASSDGPTDDALDAAAADLVAVAASVGRLFKGTPVVRLSGGRDSRLAAAAFLASGTDVAFYTHDNWPGDLDVAQRLTELAPYPIEHRIEHLASGGQIEAPRFKAVERARLVHDFADGLRPCPYLMLDVPSHLDVDTEVNVSGAGGEVAHGHYYPSTLAKLAERPVHTQLPAFATRIVAGQARAPGASAAAQAHVIDQVQAQLRRISSWGLRGGPILDQYFILQRMRRWGTTGERLGIVAPLLSSSFLAAGLTLTPQTRKAHTFHRELTRRLVPAWADVPYFPGELKTDTATMAKPRAARVVRLAEVADRTELESMLADTDDWGAGFDTDEVHRLWHLSLKGETGAYQERVLRSAVWRAGFTDHLAGIAGEAIRERPLATVPRPPEPVKAPSPAPKPEPTSPARPAVRALARSRVWRKTRNTSLGRAIRSIAARSK